MADTWGSSFGSDLSKDFSDLIMPSRAMFFYVIFNARESVHTPSDSVVDLMF